MADNTAHQKKSLDFCWRCAGSGLHDTSGHGDLDACEECGGSGLACSAGPAPTAAPQQAPGFARVPVSTLERWASMSNAYGAPTLQHEIEEAAAGADRAARAALVADPAGLDAAWVDSVMQRVKQYGEECGALVMKINGDDVDPPPQRRAAWDAVLAALAARAASAGEPLTAGVELNPNTANLVVRFARALAQKLAAAERKYGYSDGWLSPDWMDECRQNLIEHIAKGDPRDVAAYCAFLWHHGQSTAPAPSPEVRQEPVADLTFHLRIARLLAELNGETYLSEQQCAKLMGIDLVSWRRLCDCFSRGVWEPENAGLELPEEDSESVLREALGLAATPQPAPVEGEPKKPHWVSVADRLPPHDKRPGRFGVEVVVRPAPHGEPTAYYGTRVQDEGGFYKYGAPIEGITEWLDDGTLSDPTAGEGERG